VLQPEIIAWAEGLSRKAVTQKPVFILGIINVEEAFNGSMCLADSLLNLRVPLPQGLGFPLLHLLILAVGLVFLPSLEKLANPFILLSLLLELDPRFLALF
jgi:hypothetical protein